MAITTAEQLLRAGEIGRCELLRGKLRMMNPAGGEHGRITARLSFLLSMHIMSKELGTCYAAETGFTLSRDPDTVRAPDFAFLAAGRAATPESGFISGAPDLAVEVLSPDDRPGYVREKVAEWLEAGTGAVWVVDPRERTLTIYEPGAVPTTLTEMDTVRGRDPLPDLELDVHEIFG